METTGSVSWAYYASCFAEFQQPDRDCSHRFRIATRDGVPHKGAMNVVTRFACLLLLAAPLALAANPSDRAWSTTAWRADNGQNATWLWGVGLDAPVHGNLRLDASYLQGRFNQGGDLEENEEVMAFAVLQHGAWRWGAGFVHLGFANELRRGFVWSYPEEETERNADIYGPALAAGGRWSLGTRGWDIRADLVWLPHDLGDLDDVGYNGRFVQADASLGWTSHRFRVAAGYRVRHFDDVPDRIINEDLFDRDTIDGLTVSATLLF